MIKFFRKFEKSLKFYPKIIKTGVTRNIDNNFINSKNYAAVYCQTLEEVQGPWCRKNFKNMKKLQNLEKMLKLVILKS